ncbi:hypothetical protein [Christiangramia crocea]|uniref:Uncharacterized protein n=1 Tax=Christiangramia crocea TaxID=2904124 RepID=A0A9X2A5S2_9FLAO|nr:hypothetical protein [Gramella crocea]MCG9971669.1 hypothetical protein [Gramella crocea]
MFRSRPKDDYILETNWEELYVLTRHWVSNLEFYKDDLKFFRHLIDKYFIWINEKEHQVKAESIRNGVIKLTRQSNDLIKETLKHLGHIKDIMEDPFTHDSQRFREEHQGLEDKISEFIKSCRTQRRELFSITEHIVENDRLGEIIT